MAMASQLDNDPRNPCIGCGPGNPLGLRLRFRREGDCVRSELRAEERLQGWPGSVHTGVLYIALVETSNWTVYGLEGRVGFPAATSALETRARVPVGATVSLEGRVVAREPRLTVRAEAALAPGRVVAALERAYDFPTRAEFLQRMGYEDLPPVLEGAFPG